METSADLPTVSATPEPELGAAVQFHVLAQALPNQLWTSPPDGAIDWFNERVSEYSGRSFAELSGDRWARIVHAEDLPAAAERWVAARSTGTLYEIEFRLLRADGVYRWHIARAMPVRDGDGQIVRWIGTNTDIEDQKAATQSLATLNERLQQQVDQRTRMLDRAWRLSQDLLGSADVHGKLMSVNEAWTSKLGWMRHELVGISFLVFVHADDVSATTEAFESIFQTPLIVPFEFRFRHKDGSYRWFAWTGAFEDGRVYATGRDTTREHEQAAALTVAEAALRQSQKMEAVGQLTGGLAHDFNNLLTGISGGLELLQNRVAQGRLQDLERYIVTAQGAARRAAALTHRLLAFSRRQTLDPKSTDVNRLVAGMEDLIRRTMGPPILVEMVGAAGLWTTLVDPNQLENALLNLCINARDAMPDGGRLTIETGNRWLDQRAARDRDLVPGQYISLCVSDTGVGMNTETISRAFEPFYTTKPIGLGTGLGLSMVYGFVRQSGGQVRIYSEPGQGAMVCLYLPRHSAKAAETEEDHGATPLSKAEQGQTVLVVDDEPSIRMLVGEVLEDLGYGAMEAEDGAAGLRILRSNLRIDLLVTDVGLPGGMNGRQLADAARVERPNLKVLFITGYAENAVVGNGHLAPGMEVVTKPFSLEGLASRITQIIACR